MRPCASKEPGDIAPYSSLSNCTMYKKENINLFFKPLYIYILKRKNKENVTY